MNGSGQVGGAVGGSTSNAGTAGTGGNGGKSGDGQGSSGSQKSNPVDTTSGDAGEPAAAAPQFVVGCAVPESQSGKFKAGGAATTLAFTTQPSQGMVNSGLCTVEVAFVDGSGNIDASRSDMVQLALVANPNNPNATLNGVLSTPAQKGFATFTNLQIDTAASGYVLHATGNGLSANSNAFAVQVPAWSSVTVPAGSLGADANGALYDSTSTGLFTSRDGGTTWPAADANAPQGVVLVDPSNANSVYVSGNGSVNHSSDGGVTFTALCGTTPTCTPGSGAPKVEAIDSAAKVIYGVTAGAAWSSADGGTTWSQILPVNGYTPTIALGGTSPGVLFAVYGNDVLVSTDSAHRVWANPGEVTSSKQLTAITVDPTNPAKAYAGGDGGLYVVTMGATSPTYTQSLYMCTSGIAAVATTTGTALYAVLDDCPTGTNGSYPSPTFVTSLDAGSSWRNAAFGLSSQTPSGGSGDTCGASMVSDAASPGTLYLSLGACGGVYRTTNGGL